MIRFISILISVCTLVGVAEGQPASRPQLPTIKITAQPAAIASSTAQIRLLPQLADQRPGNAATVYWVAMALLPKDKETATADSGLLNQVSEYLDMPPANLPREKVESLLGKYSGSLETFQTAMQRQDCRWDLPLREMNFAAPLPHLTGVRTLTQVNRLKANLLIAQKKYEAAGQTLRSSFALARGLNDQAMVIQALVATGIAQNGVRGVEQIIRAPDSPNLYWSLTELPAPFIDLQAVAQWEKSFIEFLIPNLPAARRGELTEDEARQMWAKFHQLMGMGADGEGGLAEMATKTALALKLYPEARKRLIASGMPADKVGAMRVQLVLAIDFAREYDRASTEMWRWFVLPAWQAREGLKREAERLRLGGDWSVMVNVLVPAVGAARLRLAMLDRDIAALRCVEAIRDYAAAHAGRPPRTLADIKDLPIPTDPVLGTPFGYEVSGQTAILTGDAPPGEDAGKAIRVELTIVK